MPLSFPQPDQSSARPTLRQQWTVRHDEISAQSALATPGPPGETGAPQKPPPPPPLLLSLTPALHWRHQIRTSNIHSRQLYRKFELLWRETYSNDFFFHSFIFYCSYEVICLTSCHLKVNSNVAIVKNDCMNKKYFIKDKCIQKQDWNIPIGTLMWPKHKLSFW